MVEHLQQLANEVQCATGQLAENFDKQFITFYDRNMSLITDIYYLFYYTTNTQTYDTSSYELEMEFEVYGDRQYIHQFRLEEKRVNSLYNFMDSQ